MKLVATMSGRADKVLAAALPGRGRQALAQAFAAGSVTVNGRPARKGDPVAVGDVIEVDAEVPDAHAKRPVPQPELALETIWSDEWLVAVNKPAGLPSHPLQPHETGTAANALVARYPECAGAGADPREAGLGNRLDAGTSGILLAARDPGTWRVLRNAFREHRVRKEYLALVAGEVAGRGEIDAPIAHDPAGGARVGPDGLPARTMWTVEHSYHRYTLLRVVTQTGRMHQVRVHLSHVGTPVLGDTHYGARVGSATALLARGLVGHFLHAERVELAHPVTGLPLVVAVPLPPDRLAVLAALSARDRKAGPAGAR
jgi:23S rRNA pseudouridine1911/1915/1917 synthase